MHLENYNDITVMHRLVVTSLLIALAAITGSSLPSAVAAAELKDSLGVVAETNRSAAKSQQKIDQLSRDSRDMLEEYRKLQDGSEYQAAYTRELEELELAQQARMVALQEQISQARVTRQRIVPLMRSMVEALEQFVVLDLPFRHEERIAAVLELKERLQRPDISVSAKFRLVLEAYQLEQNYGGTIESWRGPLQLGEEELSVEYLRVGRVALYYQSLDGATSGYWDAATQQWQALDEHYNRGLAQALRVAGKTVAPQLLNLPVAVPGSGS